MVIRKMRRKGRMIERIIDESNLTKEEIAEKVAEVVNELGLEMSLEDLLEFWVEAEHDRIMNDFTDKEILEYIGEISEEE